VTLLGPIDAIAHQWSSARGQLNTDVFEEVAAAVGQRVVDVVAYAAQCIMAVAASVVASVTADQTFRSSRLLMICTPSRPARWS
jgi:hypothetical protein